MDAPTERGGFGRLFPGVLADGRAAYRDRFLTRHERLLAGEDWALHTTDFTLNNGAVGLAYLFYRLWALGNGKRFLDAARALLDRIWAQRDLLTYPEELDPSLAPTSLFHSYAGWWWLHVLVAAEREPEGLSPAIDGFLQAIAAESPSIDVAFGDAGVLLGLCTLAERISREPRFDRRALFARADRLAARIRAALVATEPTVLGFGFAHGYTGMLFALMRYVKLRGDDPKEMLDLADRMTPYADRGAFGARWPSQAEMSASWCNGSSGIAQTYALAYALGGCEEHHALALDAAFWGASVYQTSPSLCCGFVGGAFAALKAYALTEGHSWLRRAHQLAELGANAAQHRNDESLFFGTLGIILLDAELDAPACAAIPIADSPLKPREAVPEK